MPAFLVRTPARTYSAVVSTGAWKSIAESLPQRAGKLFIVTTEDVWSLHGEQLAHILSEHHFETLFFPGGEERKRLAEVEQLAEQMVRRGADRTSVVIAFGGGIVGDLGGFLAAIFMRGIPVIQVPTTLLAQVDAAVGGKTGGNLVAGKNLIGAFHQPLAVLIDPTVLLTLPEREYRAGLYEVIKCGIIRSAWLFELFEQRKDAILAQDPDVLEKIIAESVRIKAEVVSEDEKESGVRRILNFGHTLGHALEAETRYSQLLHGEAVSYGMRAVSHLSRSLGYLSDADHRRILAVLDAFGPIPNLAGITPESLTARLASDKKTLQGKVHFVLANRIGDTRVETGVDPHLVHSAAATALAELSQ